MPSRLNQLTVSEIKKEFLSVDTCVLVDFTGLGGRKAADLRHQLRAACGEGAAFTVLKTTLARRAFAELQGMAALAQGDAYLTGPTGIAYGADDPVVLARTLADWGKKEKTLKFKGGLLAGKPLAPDVVAQLAKIPPRPILLALVVGTIAAPLSGLLAVTQGPIRKFVGLVDALAKKKAEASAAA